MIKKYSIEKTDETYLRIWQKITFGKEILENSFFKGTQIPETDRGYRLAVYQYDPNTRFFYNDNNLYWVTSDEILYNYLDTGRVISIFEAHRTDILSYYIFNDLIVTDKQVINFEKYKDKKTLNLKVLSNADNRMIYLVFNEDLEKINNRLKEIEIEEEQIELKEKEEQIAGKQEKEKIISLLRQYDKMTLLEDTKSIIKGNYFVDKEAGFKVEFTDKVVNLFEKDELIREQTYSNDFINIGFTDFLYKIRKVYEVELYDGIIEDKLKKLNKKILNFKIYSYNQETKEELFLKEIKVENIVKNNKLKFKINGIKIPKQKMSKIFSFITCGNHQNDKNTIIERLNNLESYIEKIRIFSGTQLDLLEGKTIEIRLNEIRIPIHFNIRAEDKDNWGISIDNFSVKRNYQDVKSAFHYLSGGGLSAISNICDTLRGGIELETILIDKAKNFVEKRKIAEEKAEKLFAEFLEKNKSKVFTKEGGYIIKGKLKNYLIKMKNENDVGVYTYPGNDYICINEKTKAGQYLCKADKLLQFCLVMLNDGNLREEIHTIH